MRRDLMVSAAALVWLVVGFRSLPAADDKDVALMLKAKGTVELGRGRSFIAARRGLRINSGEVVRTRENSLAALIFTDDRSQLKIRENSNVTINGKREKQGILKRLSLGFGELWAKVTRQNSAMRIETPSGVATVKGTELNALYDNLNFIVFVRQGVVDLFNQFGTLRLGANEMGRLAPNVPPERMEGDPNAIFQLTGDEGERMQLEMELEGPNGEKKKLIIDFGEQ